MLKIKNGHVVDVQPAGECVLVKTKNGHVITEAAGLPVASVKAELKAGESLATAEDVIAAHAASLQPPGAESPVPAPVIEGFSHKKPHAEKEKHVEKEKSSAIVLEKK